MSNTFSFHFGGATCAAPVLLLAIPTPLSQLLFPSTPPTPLSHVDKLAYNGTTQHVAITGCHFCVRGLAVEGGGQACTARCHASTDDIPIVLMRDLKC